MASPLKLTVRSLTERKQISVQTTDTIETLKKIIAHEFSVPVDQLCLLYGGKILREPGTVQSYSLKDGGIVHMVVKNPTLSGTSAVQSEASAGVSSAAENVSHRTREELSDEDRMPSDNTAGSLDQVLSTLVPQLLQQNSAQTSSSPEATQKSRRNPAAQQLLIHDIVSMFSQTSDSTQSEHEDSQSGSSEGLLESFLKTFMPAWKQDNSSRSEQLPEVIQKLQQNPTVRRLFSDPDLVRAVVTYFSQSGDTMQTSAVKSPATRRLSPSVDVGVGATVSSTSSVRPSSTRSTSSAVSSASRSPHQNPEIQRLLADPEVMEVLLTMKLSGHDGRERQSATRRNFASDKGFNRRFSTQLRALSEMGFSSQQANVEALTRSEGDVMTAVNILLMSRD